MWLYLNVFCNLNLRALRILVLLSMRVAIENGDFVAKCALMSGFLRVGNPKIMLFESD